jgi:hypothetical protein
LEQTIVLGQKVAVHPAAYRMLLAFCNRPTAIGIRELGLN